MTDTTEPFTTCQKCGLTYGVGSHMHRCSASVPLEAGPMFQVRGDDTIELLPDPNAEREAEYRRVWLEVAMRLFTTKNYAPEEAFDEADQFLDELKKRDGG